MFDLRALSTAQQGLCLKLFIIGIRQVGLSAPLRNACCSNSKAVARCDGSRTNIMSRNPCNLGDTLLGFFSLGGGMSRILLIAWRGAH